MLLCAGLLIMILSSIMLRFGTMQIFIKTLHMKDGITNIVFAENKIEIIEDFRETDFGRFEGKNYRELSGEPYYQK